MAAKIWVGFLALVVASPIFIMAVNPAYRTPTHVIDLIGGVLLIVGCRLWDPTEWRLLNRTLTDVYRNGGIGPRAEWERAFAWLGLGLLVLAQWRSCSGV